MLDTSSPFVFAPLIYPRFKLIKSLDKDNKLLIKLVRYESFRQQKRKEQMLSQRKLDQIQKNLAKLWL